MVCVRPSDELADLQRGRTALPCDRMPDDDRNQSLTDGVLAPGEPNETAAAAINEESQSDNE